jgi:DNA-damage-inducible protein D
MESVQIFSKSESAIFGMTPSEYKQHKNLERENLRDHMTNLELIFTMLGEEGTRREAVRHDSQGFDENKTAAVKGGSAAGKARSAFEQETGEQVVTSDNFKKQIAAARRRKSLDG